MVKTTTTWLRWKFSSRRRSTAGSCRAWACTRSSAALSIANRGYVLATGDQYTVRDFLAISFEHAGLDWEKYVRFDERYLRPTEVDVLLGDATKARTPERRSYRTTLPLPSCNQTLAIQDRFRAC
ncbi:MAG: hypothetical protein HC767_10845 [Akkermansiaceae bacterium]|nr:hypothetical protein [Akkermansiaceae bacterium]